MVTIKISLKHNPTTLYYTHSHSALHCYYILKKNQPTYRPWRLNLTYCMICESGFSCLQVQNTTLCGTVTLTNLVFTTST